MNKLENTPENKARFFALYWGQNICKQIEDHFPVKVQAFHLNFPNEKDYLELKTLSSISDEDIANVASIIGETRSYQFWEIVKRSVYSYLSNRMMPSITFSKSYEVFNYLISKGYYIGDGTEVNYGWVKLKEVGASILG